ncbi:MAG: VCBS repeat-containing protein [Deltaproteobacteria bacterium]|nr:VCBS repeat-containing protein [Deltaproteobacteria bacterium]
MMNPKNSHRAWGVGLWAVLVFTGFIPLSISRAAVVKQVAILPFVIHAPERMDYLREGVQDMFASRLTWEDKVVVIDNARVQKAHEKISGPLDESRAMELGKQLGVDVVLWGSINVLGSGVSLDISVANITLRQAVKKFHAQAKAIDEVILRVGELSDLINEKVFDRARTTPATGAAVAGASQPKSPEPSGETVSPEKAPLSLKGFTINPVSPQIIIRSGGIEMGGVWRSTFLPLVLVDMAFGDLEGDGKIETVLISKKRIYIYRFTQERFQLIKEIAGGRSDNFISVDVADIHGTGLPQIFVTNYRGNTLKSLVLSWSGGAYKTIARDIPYYLRVHQLPGRGVVLLGQQKYGQQLFDTKIMILSWKAGKYIPVDRLNVPQGLTVFNFVFLASNQDGSQEILHLNAFNRLMVLSEKGKAKYSSSDPYGGTINMIQEPESGTPMGLPEEDKPPVFIPSRLIVTSLSNPGKKEIILNKNKGSILNFLARYQAYTSGEIFSLSWDGRTLKENWKTPVINDYIANYGVADFKNNGQKQLVVGIVQSSGVPLISEARSLIYCYDLGAGSPNPK